MGDWRIIKDDEEMVVASNVAELVLEKSVMSPEWEKEVERVSETTGIYQSSFNARVQNSNTMATDGKFENTDGIEVVEKETDTARIEKEGERRLSDGSSQLLRKSRSIENLDFLNSNLGKGPLGQHVIGPKNDEMSDNNGAKACVVIQIEKQAMVGSTWN
ncbi:hypothetical protein SLE2022_144050 [Rubroshorea leprosula]